MQEPVYTIPPVRVDFRTLSQEDLTAAPWHVAAHNMHAVKDVTQQGFGVRIAMLDTGCDPTHVETKHAIKLVRSVHNDDGVARQPHGQHVAGLLVGVTCGLAPNADLLSIKTLSDEGIGQESKIIEALNIAVNEGAEIISMSLGAPMASQQLIDKCMDIASKGIFIVAAAGNEAARSLGYPAAIDQAVLAVGAIDKDKRRADFSNFDASKLSLDLVDYGVQILSSITGGKYMYLSGTSQATPLVSAFLANYISAMKKHNFWDAWKSKPFTEHYALLDKTCIKLASDAANNEYGWGILDAIKSFGPGGVLDTMLHEHTCAIAQSKSPLQDFNLKPDDEISAIYVKQNGQGYLVLPNNVRIPFNG